VTDYYPDVTDSVAIGLHESVPLAHALVAHVSRAHAIRCLFVKGPSCAIQGLREASIISADVDAWVDPREVPQLISLLSERGWVERPKSPLDNFYPVHSRTLYHPKWPCDIDIHSRFPGMDGDPETVFSTIWERGTSLELAHQRIQVPRAPDHALILALHALRTPWNARGQREIEYLLAQTVVPLTFNEVYAVAEKTEASGAARPFLMRLEDATNREVEWPAASNEWLIRTTARSPGSLRLIHMLGAPWYQRPRLAANALFPKTETLSAKNLHLDVTDHHTRRSAKVTRLRTGLAAVPSALRDVVRYLRARRAK
jgi:hypothetical protein